MTADQSTFPPAETSGQTPQAVAGDSSAGDAATLEAMNRLRAVECPECGAIFAVASNLYLDRLHESGSLFCPAGHTINLQKIDSENASDFKLIDAQMFVGKDWPEPQISDANFDRRIRLLASLAKVNASTGKTVCQLCGTGSKDGQQLRRHLRRFHADEIRRLPENSRHFQ
ncbi:MAG: hypothetical protein ABSH08_16020 [Tepidisphaeraceae bacterium]|jgi:hypothetical protein